MGFSEIPSPLQEWRSGFVAACSAIFGTAYNQEELHEAFSRTKKIGVMALDHFDNGDVLFVNDLTPDQLLIAYPLYLDRLAHDIGGPLGNELWNRVFLRASEARKLTSEAAAQTLIEQVTYSPDIRARIVLAPRTGNSICEAVTLVEKSGHYLCTLETIPADAVNPEPRLADGCEALFVHLFNTLPKQEKFFLPIVLLGQCNWYQEHGLPSLMQLTAAPSHGLAMLQVLLSGRA